MDQSILGAIAKLDNPTVFTHGCLYVPKDHSQIPQYDFKSQLEELMELGLDGVKICEFKPDAYKLLGVDTLQKEYDEYIGYCERYGVHMCWHVADPIDNWDPAKVSDYARKVGWFYGDGGHPSFDDFINMTYRLLDAHPHLNVTLAHAFFKSFAPEETEALLQKYPHVTIDLAPGWGMFDGFGAHYDTWRRLFSDYADRFLFATDATMSVAGDYVASLAHHVWRFLTTEDTFTVPGNHTAHGIALEQDRLDKIAYENHQRLVGEQPKPINKPALKRYINRYLPLMKDSRNKQMIEAYARKNL
ncbi:MAG: hypothetical protein E7541_05715 [Ruminococcaceae bacterium]|nr:hypothetical protein [Oscillospiraceae bacterium]